MQTVTLLGLALCLGVLYFRARAARTQKPSSTRKRFKTAHLLVGAILVWLVVGFELQHLNHAISGEQAPQSTWEKVIRKLADWI